MSTPTEDCGCCDCRRSTPSVINDRLLIMWEKQKELNKRVGLDSDKILNGIFIDPRGEYEKGTDFCSRKDQADWLGKLHVAMGQELAEFRDSVHWKWWKAGNTDMQNVRVEIVDMFHFLMSMAQLAGMTAEDFYQGYMQKNKVNHSRQDGDYATNPNAVGGESDCKHILQQPDLPLHP